MSNGYETFGKKLAALRARRGLSQLDLSLDADVSTRHLSFLENGRASPSREMVGRLASALSLLPGEEHALMAAAGFVPVASANTAFSSIKPDGSADRTAFIGALEGVVSIQQAETIEAAAAIAALALGELGLTNFFTGVLTPASREIPLSIQFGCTSNAPVAWLAHYDQRGFRNADPFVAAVAKAHKPFFWDSVLASIPRLSRVQAQILNEAREFRITSGFVMPLRHADGTVHAVSCVGERIDSANGINALRARYVCTALLERIEDSGSPSRHGSQPPKLGPEASSFLQWVMIGKDIDWISDRVKRPLPEIGSVLATVCRDLGVSDITQAAMRARHYRLLEFD